MGFVSTEMSARKKLLYNTIFSLIHQLATVVCGFILPHFLLKYYGSEINGLLASVTQFLGFIGLAECGIGAVVRSALYKPLAEKDDDEISRIIISAERFFRKIAFLLVCYTFSLAVIYPFFAAKSFDRVFTASLILIVSFSSFVQYYFSISYSLLLEADALSFIPFTTRTLILIANTILSVLLIRNGMGIRTVKLVSSCVFLLQPIVYRAYVKKKYSLNKKLILTEEPIKQKWNGLAQHIAAVVLWNTDTVVLTLFSTLKNVSVYAVYSLVLTGLRQLVLSLTAGVQALLGNIYARREMKLLNDAFSFLEWAVHVFVIFIFTCAAVLIVPFVRVYTKGIEDVNYIVPIFGVLMCAAVALYCIRLPYNTMVLAAGHYRQTQVSALVEAGINVVISICLVVRFGLIGVAVGTMAAMLYRTCYLVWYLSKNILYRWLSHFIKHLIVDMVTISGILLTTIWWKLSSLNYTAWIIQAVTVAVTAGIVSVAVNAIFYPEYIKRILVGIKCFLYKIKQGEK